MKSTSDAKRSMKFITFLKLSVLVASQLFSIFILLSGMVWIDLGCKGSYEMCENIEFLWLYGGVLTTIVLHTYLALESAQVEDATVSQGGPGNKNSDRNYLRSFGVKSYCQ